LDWLNKKKPSDKFFLWVHLFDPHRPYYPPEKYLSKVALTSQKEKDAFINYLHQVHKLPTDFYKHPSKLLEDYDSYDAEILFVDQEFNRLFNQMEEKGLNSRALWVITADHGEGMGNHGYKGHGKYIYNEQVRIPLIFYFSNKDHPHKKIKSLVRHIDILPTLSELIGCGVEKEQKFIQGISLMPLLQQNPTNPPQIFAFSQRRPQREPSWEAGDVYALQDLKFKYIYHSEGKDEFYNLKDDPFENKDTIDLPSEDKDRMKQMLKLTYDLLSKRTIQKAEAKIDKKLREELKALGYIR
jgi:arylsulfatase A-like enzyme